ncbi:MAG: ribosomal protein S18-alanine N-acetyltransferase [Lachnospiraceae bacterium]
MLEIKSLEEQYLDEVCILEEKAFSMPWHRESFQEMIQNKEACYLVALIDGKVVGCCGVRHIVGEGEITNVVVDPSFRNNKIGYQMMQALLMQGRNLGIKEFVLEVRKSNDAAIFLYEKLGFKEEGVRKNFYEQPKEDALIMWKR